MKLTERPTYTRKQIIKAIAQLEAERATGKKRRNAQRPACLQKAYLRQTGAPELTLLPPGSLNRTLVGRCSARIRLDGQGLCPQHPQTAL